MTTQFLANGLALKDLMACVFEPCSCQFTDCCGLIWEMCRIVIVSSWTRSQALNRPTCRSSVWCCLECVSKYMTWGWWDISPLIHRDIGQLTHFSKKARLSYHKMRRARYCKFTGGLYLIHVSLKLWRVMSAWWKCSGFFCPRLLRLLSHQPQHLWCHIMHTQLP